VELAWAEKADEGIMNPEHSWRERQTVSVSTNGNMLYLQDICTYPGLYTIFHSMSDCSRIQLSR